MIAMPPKEIEKAIRKIKDTYVYCTYCKHFRLDDEEIPYCPWEDRCDINNYEDSRPYGERPFYEERKEDFMKQELHNKYITSDNQHVIYNDGSMISWWTIADGNCIEIHQSDLETDNHVFVEIEDLIDITNLISTHKNLL